MRQRCKIPMMIPHDMSRWTSPWLLPNSPNFHEYHRVGHGKTWLFLRWSWFPSEVPKPRPREIPGLSDLTLESLESMAWGPWGWIGGSKASPYLDGMVGSCNRCHQTEEHGTMTHNSNSVVRNCLSLLLQCGKANESWTDFCRIEHRTIRDRDIWYGSSNLNPKLTHSFFPPLPGNPSAECLLCLALSKVCPEFSPPEGAPPQRQDSHQYICMALDG